ncbi:PEGA domain-containing protein [Polyangium sp. 15x6]|uniref:PEGA domain-containing protein n=1 Tax=Polyangium sp. 15x6 TaxID=3042687 RepID=UPI00249C0BCE|nr:PEGA domain-containing protein [Polyangium sp. 15x6]MDI3281761.1 PEGA domain-containing protein [Polyangium sp. 15x6]
MFPPTSQKHLREAQRLEKEGKMQEALDEYQTAYDYQPLSDVQAELGFAQARMGLFLPAARNLGEVLMFSHVQDRTVHTDEEVRAVFMAVKARVGAILPRVNIPGARITVDGEQVRDWPSSEVIYVEPGKHHVKAIADDYYFYETSVEVQAGEEKTLSIAMQRRIQSHYVAFPATPMNISIHANISKASKDDQPTWPRNLMIASGVTMGLGVGGLATGLVFVNNAESKSSAATWTGVAAAGGMLLGLGVIGMSVGIASRPEPPPPNVIITPQFAKGAGGVQVTGALP